MSFSSTIAMRIRTMVVMTIILEQQASVSCIDHDIRSDTFTAPNVNILNNFDQLMARREHLYQTVQRQKPQKMSQQIYEKTHTKRGRVLLSSERERGIERSSIIVMPIDQPKVLTSENFVTGRSQRVYGESKNDKVPFSATLNPSDVAEELTMTERAQVETEEVSNTGTNGRIFPAEYWQLPPALLAARLRRYSKANIMRSLRQNARRMGIDGGKLRALMRHIDTMRREQAQRRNHRNDQLLNRKKYVPPISFLIDDESYHRTVSAIDDEKPQLNRRFVTKANLRTKFQNERSTKPITVEESDLDLLSPKISVGGTESKPYSELYNHGQTQLSLQSLSNISSQQPLPAQVNAVPSNGLGISTSLNARHPLPSAQRLPQIITASTMSPHLATVSNVVTVPPLMTPNAKLELCCRRQQLPSTCQQFCNFDTFTQEKLLIALLGTHCPSAQLSKAFDCATSKVDHSECCRQAGIDRIHNGQCMVFCRTHTKTPPNVSGYVSCLSVFGTIKNCYRDHQIKHKNLFGDFKKCQPPQVQRAKVPKIKLKKSCTGQKKPAKVFSFLYLRNIFLHAANEILFFLLPRQPSKK